MNDVTLAELGRRMDAMEQRMDARFASMSDQIKSLQFVNRDHYFAAHAALMDRIEAMESWRDKQEDEKSRIRVTLFAAFASSLVMPIILALILRSVQ